ncbi:hypothetical protein M5K25_017978 [Dendrobium thyrsiflorum]|uniref:Uncharacterized protein n=1 Tax=Dendrobium thyrsiflorum TaxID=117978 RepID=A0ABD0UHT4_DENTH
MAVGAKVVWGRTVVEESWEDVVGCEEEQSGDRKVGKGSSAVVGVDRAYSSNKGLGFGSLELENGYLKLKIYHLVLKEDGGGMDDGPDQDPMVPSSRAIVVPGLLSQRRYSTQPDRRILVDSHGLLRPMVPYRPGVGFDAIGKHTGAGHNRYIVVPFGGITTRFRGSRVITVYLQCHLAAKLPVRGHVPYPYWQEIV